MLHTNTKINSNPLDNPISIRKAFTNTKINSNPPDDPISIYGRLANTSTNVTQTTISIIFQFLLPPPLCPIVVTNDSCEQDTLLMAAAYRKGDGDITIEPRDSPASSQFLSADHRTNRNDHSGQGNDSTMTRHPAASTSSAGSNSQERSPTLLESPDDNLRTTCDSCTISKIKCDGGHPCKRCQRRKSECVYSEKK